LSITSSRQPDRLGKAVEDADDAETGQRAVDFDHHALPREVVDDVERAKPAPISERIDHEIHRPAFAAPTGEWQWYALPARQPLPSTPPDLQACLAVNAVHPFVIDVEAFATDERVQPSVAKPGPLRRVRLQPFAQRHVRRIRPSLIAPRRRTQPDQPTGASQARAQRS
jgi:hypothetical protein